MNEITIVEVAGELVVDSRIIAEQLGIEHKSLLKLVRKHQAKIEAKFGKVRFEISDIEMPNGGTRQEVAFAWLNEGQITALMTLCRNTDRVVDLKFDLVEKFSAQKKQLENPIDRALFNELANRIAKLETNGVKALPPLVPELTRVDQVKELVINYANRMGCTNPQPIWQQLYTKFGLLYSWKAIPKAKTKLSKILQIEALGKIEELYQLALKLFI
jgi:phage regulator Rha-like protein